MATGGYTALLLVLAMLVLGALGAPQYMSGYGTGPISEAKQWTRKVNTENDDYNAARAAAAIALRLFGRNVDQDNSIRDVEPVYKYKRPKFASSYSPPGDY